MNFSDGATAARRLKDAMESGEVHALRAALHEGAEAGVAPEDMGGGQGRLGPERGESTAAACIAGRAACRVGTSRSGSSSRSSRSSRSHTGAGESIKITSEVGHKAAKQR